VRALEILVHPSLTCRAYDIYNHQLPPLVFSFTFLLLPLLPSLPSLPLLSSPLSLSTKGLNGIELSLFHASSGAALDNGDALPAMDDIRPNRMTVQILDRLDYKEEVREERRKKGKRKREKIRGEGEGERRRKRREGGTLVDLAVEGDLVRLHNLLNRRANIAQTSIDTRLPVGGREGGRGGGRGGGGGGCNDKGRST